MHPFCSNSDGDGDGNGNFDWWFIMRWLQNLSFASSAPSSSSSSAASSSKNDGDNNNAHGDQQSLAGVSHRRFQFAAAKLWRRRKLRHMTDQEVSKAKDSYDALAVSSRTSSTSTAAIPMPLPLPVPEIEGQTRVQSGKEVDYGKSIEDQVRDDRNGDGFSASCPALSRWILNFSPFPFCFYLKCIRCTQSIAIVLFFLWESVIVFLILWGYPVFYKILMLPVLYRVLSFLCFDFRTLRATIIILFLRFVKRIIFLGCPNCLAYLRRLKYLYIVFTSWNLC